MGSTPDERTRTYIMVDSITESLKRIERAGGKVITPRTDIGPGMGAFGAFTVPVGNEFGLLRRSNNSVIIRHWPRKKRSCHLL